MSILTRIKTLISLPSNERNAKIKRSLQDRTSVFLHNHFGNWVNRGRTRYMVSFRPDSYYDFNRDPDFEALFNAWVAGNHENNCDDLSRFYAISLNVNQILNEGVPGDFVELGVYKGNSAFLLANFARRQNRHLFLFDTFQGFDERDLQGVDSKYKVLFADTSLEAVQNLVGSDGVTFVKGFFPDSAAQITMPEKIAVVHLDCDLYGPTKAALEWFYPLVSKGGVMILHDYSSGHWDGIVKAVNDFFRDLPEKPVLLPDKSGTAIVRKASI